MDMDSSLSEAFLAVAGVVGILVGFFVSFAVSAVLDRQPKQLPFLPSHAEALEGEHDAATRFFAAVHDMTMAIVEAWNAVHARTQIDGSVESTVHRGLLVAACDGVEAEAAALTAQLAGYVELDQRAGLAAAAVRALWTVKPDREPDGESSVEFTFRHHASRVPALEEALRQLITSVDSLSLPVLDVRHARVAIERIDGPDRLLLDRLLGSGAEGEEVDAAQQVNQWILGTRIASDLQRVHHALAAIRSQAAHHLHRIEGADAVTTAWGTRQPAGPPAFQASMLLEEAIVDLERAIGQVTSMLHGCADASRALRRWALDPTVEEPDEAYIETAVVAYRTAFPQSTLDLHPTPEKERPALVAAVAVSFGLLTFLGLVAVFG